MTTTVQAAASPAALSKRCILPTRVVILLGGTGGGSEAIVYNPPFDNVPIVSLIPPLGQSAGILSAGTPTISGFTLTVTGATLTTQNIEVAFSAHETL